MKVLVANLGSTSFKYRLFDMTNETQLARGSIDRIGSPSSLCKVSIGNYSGSMEMHVPHHGVAVDACMQQLTDREHGCLESPADVSGIGFKAVHGGRLQGVFRIDEQVLQAMEEVREVAPAHNPPYIAAMRQLAKAAADIPMVAAFETDFHRTIPEGNRMYAIPAEWSESMPLRKWGFHGASHRYIGWRMQSLLGKQDTRVVSCHLGGSSSLCAIRNGHSVATTMGMSPQSGLPQNNRVGDLDPYVLPVIMERTGKSLTEVLEILATQGGLLGLSAGLSGDIRDLESAAATGNERAKLSLNVYISEVRRHLGGMLVALGGADAIAFTGGIGENSSFIRRGVCQGLSDLGIELDETKNALPANTPSAHLPGEHRIDAQGARIQLWTIPTNEELIVARQTLELIHSNSTDEMPQLQQR